RLSVFVGGFTLEAAEYVDGQSDAAPSVCPPVRLSVLDGIASLVDKSLLRPPEPGGTEPRYTMLETIREYGLEQLNASSAAEGIRSGRAAVYLALAEDVASPGPEEAAGFDRLDAELANLRQALAWSCAGGSARTAVRLATRLGRFWLHRGHQLEGR